MKKSITIGMGVMALGASTCTAALITWNSAQTISSDLEVSSNGTLNYAYSTHPSHAYLANQTVFAPDNGADGMLGSNISLGSMTTYFLGMDGPVYPDQSRYDVMLNTCVYGGTSTTLTLRNLTAGHSYEVQYWVQDGRGGSISSARNLTLDGQTTLDFCNSSRLGQFAIGTFTADADTQTIAIEAGNSAGLSASAQLNAIQLRTTAIPEPTTAGLIAIFGTGILFARRISKVAPTLFKTPSDS